MRLIKILGILLIVLFATLVGCTRTVVVQQPDPNAQVQVAPAVQPVANQPDPTDPNNDQYWAQQAYYQWQLQNSNRDFDYFLAYVWAVQTQRSYYYQNVFGYNTYSPPLTRYRYTYRKSYTPIVVNRTTVINNRTTVVRSPSPSMRTINSPAPTMTRVINSPAPVSQKPPAKFNSGGSNFPKTSGSSGGKFSSSGSSKIWKRK